MLPAFQTYCLQQPTSVNMLNTLEKEKELLRYEEAELPWWGRCSGSLFQFLPQTFGVILNGEDGALSIMQSEFYSETRAEMVHVF